MNFKTFVLFFTAVLSFLNTAYAGAGAPATGGQTGRQDPVVQPAAGPPGGGLLSTVYRNLEISLGIESGAYNFYRLRTFSENAFLLSLSSTPSFRRTWEATWRLQLSWVNPGARESQTETLHLKDGINPLVFQGTASLMFNPVLAGHSGGGSLRLLTSLGAEAGSFIPEFRIPEIAVTEDNVGKTTGIGPRLGAGFAFHTGALTLYSMGAIAKGGVAHTRVHRYSSREVAAGLRLGGRLHLRYSIGESDWAVQSKKEVRFQRVSIGVGLNGWG